MTRILTILLAGLAHDVPVPRSQFKQDYLKAKRYVEDYRAN
jgi:hypothetical protein